MKFLFITVICVVIISCNNNSKDKKAEESVTDSTAIEPAPPRGDEYTDYKGLPVDSIEIKYTGYKDTLFGHLKNDTLIVEGDMRFTYLPGIKRGVGKKNRLWPIANNVIIIPYRIDDSYKEYEELVLVAFKYWTDSLAIRFVPHGTQKHFINFIASDQTSSEIGQVGDRQDVRLSLFAKVGNIAHEIGHVLGLFHEQNRSDRDKYVTIACDDIDYKYASNKSPDATDFGMYDYFSLMHYEKDKCMDIIKKDLPPGIPGQRRALSKGDVAAIKKMYHL